MKNHKTVQDMHSDITLIEGDEVYVEELEAAYSIARACADNLHITFNPAGLSAEHKELLTGALDVSLLCCSSEEVSMWRSKHRQHCTNSPDVYWLDDLSWQADIDFEPEECKGHDVTKKIGKHNYPWWQQNTCKGGK